MRDGKATRTANRSISWAQKTRRGLSRHNLKQSKTLSDRESGRKRNLYCDVIVIVLRDKVTPAFSGPICILTGGLSFSERPHKRPKKLLRTGYSILYYSSFSGQPWLSMKEYCNNYAVTKERETKLSKKDLVIKTVLILYGLP